MDLLFWGTYQLYKGCTQFPFSQEFPLVLSKLINGGHRFSCGYATRLEVDPPFYSHVESNEYYASFSTYNQTGDNIRSWHRALLCSICNLLGNNIISHPHQKINHFMQAEIVRFLRRLLQAGIILSSTYFFDVFSAGLDPVWTGKYTLLTTVFKFAEVFLFPRMFPKFQDITQLFYWNIFKRSKLSFHYSVILAGLYPNVDIVNFQLVLNEFSTKSRQFTRPLPNILKYGCYLNYYYLIIDMFQNLKFSSSPSAAAPGSLAKDPVRAYPPGARQ